ncbi:3-oxoacyl-ACP synthase [Formosa sediminum]|uniref:3-oxoacyl-ACP synthase n=1 Tax=Formosa sediminum TaxID=2594004 RepID=A0A516GP00_9FLAO|nr:3-oxoacyl-ACP synthase [Formosa sediminum]QDO93248.1 3-oxoacyl-ACP synthase [Formosa sediminum]
MNNTEIKQQLLKHCELFIEKRLANVQHNIAEVQDALTSETKSTAGDKHETGRAMLQLEREKFGVQLSEVNQVKQALSKIDVSKTSHTICLGSAVITDISNYFIAISAGQILVNNIIYFAIAPNTPIGKLLISKQAGEDVSFRNQKFKILNVF